MTRTSSPEILKTKIRRIRMNSWKRETYSPKTLLLRNKPRGMMESRRRKSRRLNSELKREQGSWRKRKRSGIELGTPNSRKARLIGLELRKEFL
jgi:hypothetical protein